MVEHFRKIDLWDPTTDLRTPPADMPNAHIWSDRDGALYWRRSITV